MDIAVPNQFIPIEFDVSSLNIREIRRLGFFVNQNPVSQAVIQLDKIDFEVTGYETYKLEYLQASYTLDSKKQRVKAEFGTRQKRLEDYVEGLLTTADELRFTGEVR